LFNAVVKNPHFIWLKSRFPAKVNMSGINAFSQMMPYVVFIACDVWMIERFYHFSLFQ